MLKTIDKQSCGATKQRKRLHFGRWLASAAIVFCAQTASANEVCSVVTDFTAAPADFFNYSFDNASVSVSADNGDASGTASVAGDGEWGGFGAPPNAGSTADWSAYDGIQFSWVGQNSGVTHDFEIQTTGGNFRVPFTDNFSGLQVVQLPLSGFTGVDLTAVTNWVVVLDGYAGTVQMDDIALYSTTTCPVIVEPTPTPTPEPTPEPTPAPEVCGIESLSDFAETPADFFVYSVNNSVSAEAANGVLSGSASVAGDGEWGGFGAPPATTDWSGYDFVQFEWIGQNSGHAFSFEAQSATGNARVAAAFTDNFTGAQLIQIPIADFVAANPAADLSAVTNWVVILDGYAGTFQMDNLSLESVMPCPTPTPEPTPTPTPEPTPTPTPEPTPTPTPEPTPTPTPAATPTPMATPTPLAPPAAAGLSLNPSDGSTLSGGGEAGATITVEDSSGTILCTTTVQADNTWACTPSPAPAVGAELSITQAGGASGTLTSSFRVAPAAQNIPVFGPLGLLALLGGLLWFGGRRKAKS